MPQQSIAVLKFGSSVLRTAADYSHAVAEILRHRDRGHAVVAVVSALGDDTDALLARANEVAATHDEALLAELLACGEHQSSLLLTLALQQGGHPAKRMDGKSAGLVTRGTPMQARPHALATAAIRENLAAATVVIPGFTGIDATGRTTLLGRGGSDMTALFVAERLQADRCRLIKDVDGIFSSDPAVAATRPLRFRRISWDDAQRVGGRLVQARAVRFAADRGFTFEVGALGSDGGTVVCAGPNQFYADRANATAEDPRRVAVG